MSCRQSHAGISFEPHFAEVRDDHFVNNHVSQILADDIEFNALIVTRYAMDVHPFMLRKMFISFRGQIQYAASDFLPSALSKSPSGDADKSCPNAFQLAARTKLTFFEWLHQRLPEHDVDWRFPTPQQYQRYSAVHEYKSLSDVTIPRPEKELFNVAMGGFGRAHDRCCIEDYPWHRLGDEATIVDVGGGIGKFEPCIWAH